MRDDKKIASRPPRLPPQGRHRHGRRGSDAGNTLDDARASRQRDRRRETQGALQGKSDHVKAYYRVNRYPG